MRVATLVALTVLALAGPIALANHAPNSCIDMLGGTAYAGVEVPTGQGRQAVFALVADNGHGIFLYQESNGIDGLQRGAPCPAYGVAPDALVVDVPYPGLLGARPALPPLRPSA